MDLIIRNGTIVTEREMFKADLGVKDGKIAVIAGDLSDLPCENVVDATGKLVLPGAIDAHTHLAFPFGGTVSSDDFFAGTRAAACGGTTTVFDYSGQADSDGNVTIQRKDNVFQMCFTDPNQGVASAQYIKEQKLGTKIAIIYNNGDAYSTGIYQKFAAEAKKEGLEIVSTTTFPDDTNSDFSAQLNDAKAKGADLLFLPIYYTPASLILTQANKMGYTPKFFGVDGMDGILTVKNFDTKLAENVMLLTPFTADATDEKTQNFVKKYKEKFGETPNQFAADTYDCVYALYEACKAKV